MDVEDAMDNILVSPENLYQEIEISEDVSEGLPGIFWCPKCKGGAGWLRRKTVCASEEADSGALTWRRPIGPQQECPWTVGVLPTYVPTYPPDCLLCTYLIGLWIGCWQIYHPFPVHSSNMDG